MLYKSGESKHFCPHPDLRGKSFQLFSIEYDVNRELVVYGLYYVVTLPIYSQQYQHGWGEATASAKALTQEQPGLFEAQA